MSAAKRLLEQRRSAGVLKAGPGGTILWPQVDRAEAQKRQRKAAQVKARPTWWEKRHD